MSGTEDNEKQLSMEELLDSYGPGSKEALRVGSKLSGKIISIGKESVFVDTGSKVDGVVDLAELVDENGDLPYQVGDTLDLYIMSMRPGEIRLSRALAGVGVRSSSRMRTIRAFPSRAGLRIPARGLQCR